MKYLAMLAVALVFAGGCKKNSTAIHAEYKSITQSVYASGLVKARNQYQVFSTVPGIIGKMLVAENDVVHEGQTLVQITNQSALLNSNNSELAAQYNALQNNQEKLEELMVSISAAKQKRDNDSLQSIRQYNLFKQGVGSKNEFELKQLAASNSKASHESAVYRLQQLQKQLQFLAQQTKVNLAISRSQTNDLLVKSTLNGRVYSVLKKQGEMVSAQTPIAILGEDNNYYLELQIDEYDIANIAVGQNILVTMDSYGKRVFKATVTKIYPLMNERTKSFTLEALFTEAPSTLYPNLSIEANIIISSKEKALLIPRSYLVDNNYVVLENGQKRKVTLGIKDYQKAEVLSGISVTDAIVQP